MIIVKEKERQLDEINTRYKALVDSEFMGMYCKQDFKWYLGLNVMVNLNHSELKDELRQEYTKTKLFGIECAINRLNPDGIALYLDVTDVF